VTSLSSSRAPSLPIRRPPPAAQNDASFVVSRKREGKKERFAARSLNCREREIRGMPLFRFAALAFSAKYEPVSSKVGRDEERTSPVPPSLSSSIRTVATIFLYHPRADQCKWLRFNTSPHSAIRASDYLYLARVSCVFIGSSTFTLRTCL